MCLAVCAVQNKITVGLHDEVAWVNRSPGVRRPKRMRIAVVEDDVSVLLHNKSVQPVSRFQALPRKKLLAWKKCRHGFSPLYVPACPAWLRSIRNHKHNIVELSQTAVMYVTHSGLSGQLSHA